MYPLHHRNDHLFVQIDRQLWLLDTGSPHSFGRPSVLCMKGKVFHLPDVHQELNVDQLCAYLGVDCEGLIGADIISQFDLLLDVPAGTIDFMLEQAVFSGQEIPIAHYQGVPVIEARIAGQYYEMFFDTGARISYIQDEGLVDFPQAGLVLDFYHGYGEYEVLTHHVPAIIGNRPYNMRFGRLPELLGMAVFSRGPSGIIGNEWLTERRVGYFPSRGVIMIDPILVAGIGVPQRGEDQSYSVH